jgi:hypothetical protein
VTGKIELNFAMNAPYHRTIVPLRLLFVRNIVNLVAKSACSSEFFTACISLSALESGTAIHYTYVRLKVLTCIWFALLLVA